MNWLQEFGELHDSSLKVGYVRSPGRAAAENENGSRKSQKLLYYRCSTN